jgi:hypothetical protein
MVNMYLLVPENFHEISKQSGLDENVLQGLYDHDQSFGLVTKIVVVDRSES